MISVGREPLGGQYDAIFAFEFYIFRKISQFLIMKLKKKEKRALDKNQKAEKTQTCNLWWFLKKEKKRVGIFLVEALERFGITWISSDQKKPKVVCRLQERKTPTIFCIG